MAKRYSTTTAAGEAFGGAVVPPGGSGSPAPDEGAHGGSPASDDQPKPKKARSAMSKVKGRRGAMSAFNSLPIDLLFDVSPPDERGAASKSMTREPERLFALWSMLARY